MGIGAGLGHAATTAQERGSAGGGPGRSGHAFGAAWIHAAPNEQDW